MRANLEDNISRRMRQNSPRFGASKVIMRSDFVIPTDGPAFYNFDANGSDRIVRLPDLLPTGGQWYLIGNVGSANALNIRDSLGVLLAQVGAGFVAMLYSGPGNWKVYVVGATPNAISVALVLSGAAYNAAATDDVILVKKTVGSATSIVLPSSTLRQGVYLIKDGKGDANTNPITITGTAELIDSLAAGVVISTPFGSASVLSVPGQGLFLTNFG